MANNAMNELPLAAAFVEMASGGILVSRFAAVAACVFMALGYVLILYFPSFVLRLPSPTSLESFLIRRFTCALVFSFISVLVSAALLGLERFGDLSSFLNVYGIRKDHTWQAVVFPLFLTCLLYAGSFMSKSLLMLRELRDGESSCCGLGLKVCLHAVQRFLNHAFSCAHNVVAWRNYVVAPFTEELVFRGCMIPLLLCSGFQTYSIIFLSPISFSLAHVHHFMELYYQQGYSFLKAFSIVGLQLGYTMVFGWYASFLFLRTGQLVSAIVVHVLCNLMGLPVLFSSSFKGLPTIGFILGLVCFFFLLFPASNPLLYNNGIDSCSCGQGYCNWH
ncbi:hypothetical protein HPP92_006122 [Vanilla planifolia]|uniref:intramembrane prenyl-peptidase Rce1 n=1 Tax=Vanilla planifolia TaxID=51239 RepID=A0A835VFD2_VANPL|nr:hypothetical protein HPP92_006122 [Vanilla planifolia]